MILTAEADNKPTNAKELLDDCGVIRAEAMTCQSTQEVIPQDMFGFYGNQMMTEMDMPKLFRSSVRERFAEQLTHDLEPVASTVEGSDLGSTEDPL